MTGDEHIHFFPVIVLLALILIALSFKLILRMLVVFFVIIGVWYCLYYVGLADAPLEKSKKPQETPKHV